MFHPQAFYPVLRRISQILDELGVRFHLTGGLAAIYYATSLLHDPTLIALLNEVLTEPDEIDA